MSEWSRGDASDIDGQTKRSKWAGAHESISKLATEMSGHRPSNRKASVESVRTSETRRILCWRQIVSAMALITFG